VEVAAVADTDAAWNRTRRTNLDTTYLYDISCGYIMELNRTTAVILGMLELGFRTGYEIKAAVDKSTRFFWAASYGQIYPELARLEKAGLVRGERIAGDARARKAYELTAAGRRTLREWLTAEEPLYFELRHEGLLKVFFYDAIEHEDRVRQIRLMRAEHERTLRELQAVRGDGPSGEGPRFPSEVLTMGLEHEQFVIDWCARFERTLKKKGS
jgi:PadR family transcriptional regulator AphA